MPPSQQPYPCFGAQEKDKLGTVPLRDVLRVTHVAGTNQMEVAVTGRVYNFCASSEPEAARWVADIQRALRSRGLNRAFARRPTTLLLIVL